MVNLTQYRSHPDKHLLVHTQGVIGKVRSLTTLKVAEIAALFHDIGKLNPNFQKKLDNKGVSGYSKHAYLSALSFLSYCISNKDTVMESFDGKKEYLGAIIAIIAHHHGDIPDFPCILDANEYTRLLSFLKQNPDLPVSGFLQEIHKHNNFNIYNDKLNIHFQDNLQYQLVSKISNPVKFFLETQFAFATLIAADKSDAGGYELNAAPIQEFCIQYHSKLSGYLKKFNSDSDINRLRSQMREEACHSLVERLVQDNTRVFSLTAPTGAGKTIILLSLAGEILKHQNNLKIIYALPYLSITEQVESICQEIFNDNNKYICRIDSKAENAILNDLQCQLDEDPNKIKDILSAQFAEDTFDFPFIITTFVRLFETLLSNKNATLLKLPNFSNAIFLIDEIQSLPPRLYGFFIAMLDAFCRKFNAYAVISTATMPNFLLPQNNKHNLSVLFKWYVPPPELLPLSYFDKQVFNRYIIQRLPTPIELKTLADLIQGETKSVLIILNTIQDTKDLFNELSSPEREIDGEIILLNTHFTPNDRKDKIKRCKKLLRDKRRILLISTQLIEAGVDIDFPVIYRDICPISSIVQSAGRCNRNGAYPNKGKMITFDLVKDGCSRSATIYRGKDSSLLIFAKEHLKESAIEEAELLDLQKTFFNNIQTNLLFGVHYYKSHSENKEIDFIESLKKGEFSEIGKFRLNTRE